MASYMGFERAVRRNAWRRTVAAWSPVLAHWPQKVALWVIGAALGYLTSGPPTVRSALIGLATGSAVAFALGFFGLYALNVFTAPFQLWRADRLEIERLNLCLATKRNHGRNIR